MTNQRTKTLKKKEPESRQRRPAARNDQLRKAHFHFKADPDRQVFLVGSFTSWNPAEAIRLAPNDDGRHAVSILLPPGRHEYKFLVDNEWSLDPECAECVPNAFGTANHVIEVR
jgi:hypothetical protein